MRRQDKGLVEEQKTLIQKALGSYEPTTWKIIVFDGYNRNILSSQFKMKDLRDHNITLYMNIKERRQQLHGVTIIYLLQPTLENVELIASDLIADLYSSVVVHFTSQPTPNILSTLAKNVSSKKPTLISRITRIQYSCIGYFSIDNHMAILPSPVQIANLLISMKLKPIFIYNSGDEESQELVEKTKSKLTNHEQEENTSFGIVYVYNRENDHFSVLSHGISYASLNENINTINNLGNKVVKTDKQSWDLSLTDDIWVRKKNMNIGQMELQKQFNKIKSKMVSLSQEQYSQYNEKSKKVQWHINNAEDMLKEAKRRRLNEFNELEREMYSKKNLGKEQFKDLMDLLADSKVQPTDKVRIMLIYIMVCEHIDQLQDLEGQFPDIKKNNKFNEIKLKRMKESTGGQRASGRYIKKFAKGLWSNLVSGQTKFPLTKDLQKIKKCEFNELREAGLAIDCLEQIPKNVRISQTVAYCMGGICFHEYQNIYENDPQIIYCGNELINAKNII